MWYFVFLIGLNGYLDHFYGIFHGIILSLIFIGIDLFLKSKKINLTVKTLITLIFVFNHIGFNFPNTFRTIYFDFYYLFYAEFQYVKVTPFLLNVIFFLIFRKLYISKNTSNPLYILGIFLGGSLLLSLSLLQGTKFSLLTIFYIFIGITLIIFNNLDQSTIKITSDSFLFTLFLSILMIIIGIWSIDAQVVTSWEEVKNYFTGGFGSGGREIELELPYFSYNSDDSRLGGPIQLKDTPVLRVFSDRALYLRGESRYIYTGKGWTNDIISRQQVSVNNIPFEIYQGIEYQQLEVEIEILEGSYPLLFAPYGTTKFSNLPSESLELVNGNDFLLKYYLHPGARYSLQYNFPSYPPNYLRENHPYPDDFPLKEYTNLPDDLPQNIIELAQNLTAPYTNNYDKAFALQRYFRSREFSYNLEVPYPPENMDFVEHFLEIKEGYCVHFSTAFVVMARSVGIPARWVKGYFTGNRLSQGEYLVREEHAHAWGEVYFPQVGWVIFETTPGYGTGRPQEREGDEENPPLDTDNINPTDPIDDDGGINGPPQGVGDEKEKPFEKNSFILIVFLWILGGYIVLWYKERKISVKERIIMLYNNLLFKLRILGFKKLAGETPREFLYREKMFKDLNYFHYLTFTFEKIYYGDTKGEKGEYDNIKKGRGNFIYNLLKRMFLPYKKQKTKHEL